MLLKGKGCHVEGSYWDEEEAILAEAQEAFAVCFRLINKRVKSTFYVQRNKRQKATMSMWTKYQKKKRGVG